jgi:hypothetical protein
MEDDIELGEREWKIKFEGFENEEIWVLDDMDFSKMEEAELVMKMRLNEVVIWDNIRYTRIK